MLGVVTFALICGVLLYILDKKCEANEAPKAEDPEQDKLKEAGKTKEEPNLVMQQVELLGMLPLNVYICYVLCIMFYGGGSWRFVVFFYPILKVELLLESNLKISLLFRLTCLCS